MAAVLAGVELVSLDFTQVGSAQTGVGRDRDSGCYKRRITPGPSDNVYRKLTDCGCMQLQVEIPLSYI